MKDEEWLDVMDTNLNAIYRLSKACLRGMTKARWGRIITIGSVVASTGNPGQTNYSATKAGVLGFTKSLARELGPRNITVNCISPGFIDTDMTKNLPEATREELLTSVPLGRFGSPEEVAEVVSFLAGDTGAYITGENIHVNGGMYMP
jgi:3-oxoacyl-[acyl-carrier protein] reductase